MKTNERSPNLLNGVLIMGLGVSFILSTLLGMFWLVWIFRLIHLKYLVTFFHVSRLNALSMGQVAVKGRVMPSVQGLVEHPSTGEFCVYYSGIEKTYPKHRIFLEDTSGQIVVNPEGATFLCRQQLLFPGDSVSIIAHVNLHPHRGKHLKQLSQSTRTRSWVQTLFNQIINGLNKVFSGNHQSQMLLTDPYQCFWIWNDAQYKPLSSTGDFFVMLVIIFFACLWFVIMGITGLAIWDPYYAQLLNDLLNNPSWHNLLVFF